MKTIEELKKDFHSKYDEYCKITREAFETEGHFYANKPRTPELGQAVKEAYKSFDIARNAYLTATGEKK